MTNTPMALALHGFVVPETPARKGPGLLDRVIAALVASRQAAAEREISLYLKGRGGKFTDETEREIERRFLSTPSGW